MCGQVKVGDLVTEINGVNISLMSQIEITNIVKKTGDTLVLTIGGMYFILYKLKVQIVFCFQIYYEFR